MAKSSVLITITGTKICETGKAVKFDTTHISGEPLEKPRTEWFPFSQIEKMFTDPATTGNDTLTVKEWILKEKGMV